VITTDARHALDAVIDIDDLRREVEQFQAKTDISAQPTSQLLAAMGTTLDYVQLAAKPLGLAGTLRTIDYLKEVCAGYPEHNAAEVLIDLEHLRETLVSEMGAILFLYLNPERVKYMVGDDPDAAPFGDAVLAAFPSAAMDVREASNAYALERWPASVFHLMRVLEFGLGALAARFGVSVERSTWHEIIEAIEGKIRKIAPASEGADWKKQQKEFSDAATQFMFFKDAWRNHIMHVRDVYDEGRAMSIFQHVREFMNKLATIGLKELE
jgi:hypothetical protein